MDVGVRKWKWFRSVALLLASMLVLTACLGGGGGGGGAEGGSGGGADRGAAAGSAGSDGGASSGGSKPSGQPAAGGKMPDPVELTIHAWFLSPSIKAAIDLFMETYPWITVKHNGSINQYIINNIVAGEDSDIIFLDHGLSQWITGGNDLLVELTPYIQQDERIQEAKLNEGMMEAHMVGDKIYTLPFADIPMWIAVNKDLLD